MKSKLVGEAKQASQSRGDAIKKTKPMPLIQKRPRERWLLPAVAVIGLFLVVGLVAGIVLRLKTKDGTIVIEGLTPDSHVFIDQEKVTFTLIDGHKTTIEHVIRGQKHKLKVTREGFVAFVEDELDIEAGGGKLIHVVWNPIPPPSVPGPIVGQTGNPSKIPGIMPPSESTKDVAKTPNTPTTGRVESEDAKSKTQESSSLSDLLRAGTELTGDWMGLANPQGGEVKIQIKERDGKKLKGIHSANFKDGQWFHWDMEGEVVADTFNYHSVGSVHKYYTHGRVTNEGLDCISGENNVPALKMMLKLPSELKKQVSKATLSDLLGAGVELSGDWKFIANSQGGEVKILIKERDGKKLKGVHSANFRGGQWFSWDMEGEVVGDTINYRSVGNVHKYYVHGQVTNEGLDCTSGEDGVPALKMMMKLPSREPKRTDSKPETGQNRAPNEPKTKDLLQPGTVWAGTLEYLGGAQAIFRIHVRILSRDGSHFKGVFVVDDVGYEQELEGTITRHGLNRLAVSWKHIRDIRGDHVREANTVVTGEIKGNCGLRPFAFDK